MDYKALYEEALRQLNRKMGMDYTAHIESIVAAGMRSYRCEECGGSGQVSRYYPLGGDAIEECDYCDAKGYVIA